MILAMDFDATVAMSRPLGRPVQTAEGAVFVAEHVEAMLHELDRMPGLRCAWYSGREEDAADSMRRALGLDWPFIPLGTLPGTDVERKLDGLTAWGWWDGRVPCLLVDDAPPPAAWLPESVQTLRVAPERGITPDQAGWIVDWAARSTMGSEREH